MKKVAFVLSLMVISAVLVAVGNRTEESAPEAIKIIGSWKLVKARYGDGKMEEMKDGETAVKIFSATRWAAAFYNNSKKTYDGAGGGTYKLEGDKYTETIEYFSWDNASAGQTVVFTMKIENGMLHQYGTLEYKGNKAYVIDEWSEKID
jgi:hypothetical protein